MREAWSTLFPVAASRARARTSTPWQIAATGRPSCPNWKKVATSACSAVEPRYCRMPGACPPGKSSASNSAGTTALHAIGRTNSGAEVSSP